MADTLNAASAAPDGSSVRDVTRDAARLLSPRQIP